MKAAAIPVRSENGRMFIADPGLAKRVTAACRARGLTVDALARQLGLNRIQLTLILAGRDPVSHALVERLGALLEAD